MKKSVLIFAMVTVLFACNSSSDKNADANSTEMANAHPFEGLNQSEFDAKLSDFEKMVFDSSKSMDIDKANQLIDGYVKYADEFSKSENSAEYLFKAAEISLGLNHSKRSLELYKRVYTDYPNYEKRPYSLFLQAFIYENNMKDLDAAKSIYEQFIQDYPNHDMADDAEYSLKNLGKSPDELIKEFEAKQKGV